MKPEVKMATKPPMDLGKAGPIMGKPIAQALPAPPATPQPPKGDGTLYSFGTKKYNPKVDHNKKTWSNIQAVLIKGPCTLADLNKVCTTGGAAHGDFVGYMVRGKHIAPVK